MNDVDAAPVERNVEPLAIAAQVLLELPRGRCRIGGSVLASACVGRYAVRGKPHAAKPGLRGLDPDRPDRGLERPRIRGAFLTHVLSPEHR